MSGRSGIQEERLLSQVEALRKRVQATRDPASLYRVVAQGYMELLRAERALLLHETDCERGPEVVFVFPHAKLRSARKARVPIQDPLHEILRTSPGPVLRWEEIARDAAVRESRAYQELDSFGPWHVAVPIRQGDYLAGVVLLSGAAECRNWPGRLDCELGRLSDVVAYAMNTVVMFQRMQQQAREKATLIEVGKRISSSLDLREVLETVVEAVRQVVACDHAAVFLVEEGKGQLRHAVYRGEGPEVPRNFRLKLGQGLVGWVAITGRPVLVRDVRKDSRYFRLFPDSRSELDVPLVRGDRILGVISLESRKRGAFGLHHLELLRAFAGQAAVAIENALLLDELVEKRRLEQELRVAREVQRALLPKGLPRLKGYSLFAVTVPSGAIGGDLYDVVEFADRSVALAVGDVSGKGTPGAILMATLYSTYRGLLRRGFEPGKLMRRLNNLLVERLDQESFATFFLSVLDPPRRRLRYSNAGHNPPLLVREDGTVERLVDGGAVLGFVPGLSYITAEVELQPGDVLVMYTDGVTEVTDSKDELFGEERLIELISKYRKCSPRVLKEKVLKEVRRFSTKDVLEDDITLVILKVH